MEALMAVIIGAFFGIGIHLLQQRSILRLALGTMVISHATNLILISIPGVKRGAAPIISLPALSYTDPIPHALILTAIVIGFGVTAFLLVLAYRTYQEFGNDDMDALRDPEGLLASEEGDDGAR